MGHTAIAHRGPHRPRRMVDPHRARPLWPAPPARSVPTHHGPHRGPAPWPAPWTRTMGRTVDPRRVGQRRAPASRTAIAAPAHPAVAAGRSNGPGQRAGPVLALDVGRVAGIACVLPRLLLGGCPGGKACRGVSGQFARGPSGELGGHRRGGPRRGCRSPGDAGLGAGGPGAAGPPGTGPGPAGIGPGPAGIGPDRPEKAQSAGDVRPGPPPQPADPSGPVASCPPRPAVTTGYRRRCYRRGRARSRCRGAGTAAFGVTAGSMSGSEPAAQSQPRTPESAMAV